MNMNRNVGCAEIVADYVVVGAGSAGSVLADRLSSDGSTRVVVLEAGPPDRSVWLRIPLGIAKVVTDPAYTWEAETEAEAGLNGGRVKWQSGRVVGGSSSINGMIHVRGHPSKYDEWRDDGCPGWGFADLSPFFSSLEDCAFASGPDRGKGGPIGVTMVKPDQIGSAFIASCEAIGIGKTLDYNNAQSTGAGAMQLSTRRGIRSSAATGYLRGAAKRSNVSLLTNAMAERVLFQGRTAVGVQFRTEEGTFVARANKEVILSAGAIRSPQLLELSGIGQANVLMQHDIPVIHELPGVGENLQDHFMGRVAYECTEAITLNDVAANWKKMLGMLLQYAFSRDGLLATSSFTALAFLRSGSGEHCPNIRLQVGLSSGTGRLSSSRANGLDPHSGFHIGGYFLFPRSRGSLHIKSPDIANSPSIRANYLTDRIDCEMALKVLRIIRSIAASEPLAKLIVREVRPGPFATDNDALLDYYRATGHTCWHPVGTCRMGVGPNAVVDPLLRVHGVERLRVLDASIMPFLPASNTNIPTIAIAERGARLIMQSE